jgi:ABC-type antimicrobial peptide transport system permease subunit
MTNTPHTNEIAPLPFSKVIAVAWRGIRIRIWRSLLVVSCITLAIAFLSYILLSDAFTRHITVRASQELLDKLIRQGTLDLENMTSQRVQTYWMAGLALLISFVGIINAMLMSVAERFREIGTMKCLGALDSFVLLLFLAESLFQAVVGTTGGIILGLALAYGEGFTIYGTETLRLASPAGIAAAIAISFSAGIILTVLGALYPAWQAARMAPVMALRSEV